MTEYGIKADYKHDYSEGSKYQPRYLATFAERGDANGVIGDQDPFWIVSGPSGDAATDGFVKIGIADGSGSWPDIGTAAYIKLENGKVTVNPGIVLNPTTEGAVPDTKGSLMYDSGTDELKYFDGSWQIVSAGGLSAHALDGVYHTATGLTVGWVLSADSATTFSWKAPTGGGADPDAIHDNVADEITAITPKITLGSTDEFILEDGGASFVKKAVTFANIESSINLANLGTRTHASLSDAPADAHHVAFVLADFTTAFAAESLANLTTRAHSDLSDAPTDAHHTEVHVLSGSDHTATGLTVGWVLSADSATTFSWKAPTGGMIAHDLTGAYHTEDATGGSGNVIVADSGTTFSWQQLDYSELASIPSTFDPIAHDLTSAYHTDSGLTGGHFLKADTTTTFSFQAHGLGASDVGAYTTAQVDSAIDTDISTHAGLTGAHHAQQHDLTGGDHSENATGGAGNFLKADSATTFSWQAHGLGASDVGAYTTAQVDSAIDTDISTHAGLPTVHQDAPALISTHASDDDAHHALVTVGGVPLTLVGQAVTFNYDANYFRVTGNDLQMGIDAPNTDEIISWSGTQAVWIAHVVDYTTSDFTTDFAAESLANLTTRAHSDLSDAPTDAHHSESHVLSGSTHTASGLTIGHVIAADSATTFSWQAPTVGSGTQWALPVWATTSTFGDSMISQDASGTLATINGDLKVVGTQIYGNGTTIDLVANTTTDGPRLILYHGAAAFQFFYDNVERAQLTGAGNFQHDGTLTIGTIATGVADYNAFLVSDSGVVKFRTGAEVASDIGAVTVPLALTDLASYTQGSIIKGGVADWEALGAGTEDYVLKMGAAEPAWGQVDWSELTGSQPAPISHDFDVHTGDVDLVDIAGYAQGSIIKGGASDWESLVKGTENYVLKAEATDIAWGTVDWSELTGTQPAPVAHNLIDTTGHPVSALTGGHFLKALTTTTYGFTAHGLGAGDVGAYTTAEVDSAIDTDITTHTGDDNAHHEVIETADVEGIITAEIVDGQSIDNAIDALISTHDVAGAHILWEDSAAGTIHTDNYLEYTDAAVESVITAELVNGQSIDNAIDSLIGDHAGDDDIHHAVFTITEFTTAFAAEDLNNLTTKSHDNLDDVSVDDHHAQSHSMDSHPNTSLSDPGATKLVYWDNGANLFNFLNAGTGLTISGVNLNCDITQYTDTMAENVIDTELGDGYSIDAAIDGLILTHKNDNDAHHALVTVTALPLTLSGQAVTFNYNTNHFKLTGNNLEIGTDTPGTDEVLKWSGTAAVWSTSAGGTDYDPDLVIGSGNATWINCPYEGTAAVAADKMIFSGQHIPTGTYSIYSVPLPTTRGGKSLYISGTRVSLSDASSDDFVTSTYIYGMGDTTKTTLDTDLTDKLTVALHEDLSMGAKNLGGYDVAKIAVLNSVNTQGALLIQYITVRYYYA